MMLARIGVMIESFMAPKGYHADIYDWLPWLRPADGGETADEDGDLNPDMEDRLFEISAQYVERVGESGAGA